jgi:hypothetical protein
MQVQIRQIPDEIDEALRDRITDDVSAALASVCTVGNQFIVNDTIWYGENTKGVKPRVVNTAGFISQKFEMFLKENRNWRRQKKLEGQTIDAYVELQVQAGYTIEHSDFFSFLEEYTADHSEESLDAATVRLFQMYVKRSCFTIGLMEQKYRGYFHRTNSTGPLKIGLEFETGNIASSFRSLNKLNFLYRRGKIDAGVFITSRDKNTAAARIWPVSNRNGSVQELERRNYKDSILFPIWEIGFAPDGFSPNAEYLGRGGTYALQNIGTSVEYEGLTYEVWRGGGKQVLRPIQPST